MMELGDMPDLESGGETRAGSTPVSPTKCSGERLVIDVLLFSCLLMLLSGLVYRCPGCKKWVRRSKTKRVWDNTGMTLEPDYVCMSCLVADRLMETKKFLAD